MSNQATEDAREWVEKALRDGNPASRLKLFERALEELEDAELLAERNGSELERIANIRRTAWLNFLLGIPNLTFSTYGVWTKYIVFFLRHRETVTSFDDAQPEIARIRRDFTQLYRGECY